MLLQATIAVTLFGMGTTLWMGCYLFARGFPSLMTLRVVVAMLALSGFFFGSYNNIFVQHPGQCGDAREPPHDRAGGLVQCDLSRDVRTRPAPPRYRFVERGIYALGTISIIFLLQPEAFILEQGTRYTWHI